MLEKRKLQLQRRSEMLLNIMETELVRRAMGLYNDDFVNVVGIAA